MTQTKKKTYKGIAIGLSLCMLLLWAILGTGASLAWFTDTTDRVNNIFRFGEFEVEVSHRVTDEKGNVTWETIEAHTDIFDDEALYEPGYVQVVYLKVENKGDVAFDFQTTVSVTGSTAATNVSGQEFFLQDHLKFGVVAAATEAELEQAVANRGLAEEVATMKLGDYTTDAATLEADGTAYLALIVRMPEDVDNVANYRGEAVPGVELGIIAKATQTH